MRNSQLATRNSLFACASLVLVALLASASLWGPGMVNTRGGGDSPFLLQRTHQMVVNLRAGIFPVRWMPDAAYGLGYPFFSYYAALPYYLAGLFVLVGLDVLTALKLVQTLGFVAAALAMYGWMHRLTRNRWAAWLAAVAYTVAPFHLVNVYVRGDSLSEFYAFVFYPLILWALDNIRRSPSATRNSPPATHHSPFAIRHLSFAICHLSFAYAGLILTHNLSAFIFAPFALLYLVVLAWRKKGSRWRVFGLGLLGLGLSLLLSAWYWLPAVAELGYVQLGPSTQDYFHYSRHFRTTDLVQPSLLFNYSVLLSGSTPFAMGLIQAVFAALGGLVLIVRGVRRRLEARWAFVLLGLLVSTAMITPLSRPLWDHLPLLPIVQFPWRFLSVQALFAAAATAALALAPPPARNTRHATRASFVIGHLSFVICRWSLVICHWSFVILTAALLIASVLLPLRPDRLPIGPADVTVERLQLYELFTENIGTSIRYEWLPGTANPRPFTSDALIEPDAPPRAIPLDGASLEAALVEREPIRQMWHVWGEGGVIAFPLLYWPGWGARVDGEPVEVWPVEGSGYLALDVPPGEHTVLLHLGRTPLRAAAEAMSLCALVVLIVAVVGARRQPSRPLVIFHFSFFISHFSFVISHLSFVICHFSFVILLLSLVFIAHSSLFIVHFSATDLTMDFEQMPYLHHNPDGVNFGGVARLAGYTLSAEELAPGDTLTVTLDWTEVGEGIYTATVRLVSPAAIRREVEPLAEATLPLSPCPLVPLSPRPLVPLSPCPSVPLSLPTDTPRGLYLLQLHLFGPAGELRALTPAGNSRGTLYLQSVRVPNGPVLPSDVAVLAPFGPAIRLHAATIAQPAPDRLAVQLVWSAARPLAANYGISLRLLDADGWLRASLDTQPGYGFLPTSLWQPGELVTDRYLLALPDDLPPGDDYRLQVVLYQVPSLAAVGQALLGDFAFPLAVPFEARRPPRVFSLPALQHQLEVDFGGQVRLAGYELEQGEDALRLTLWWQALQEPQADYTVFVHLFDPNAESIVAQSDALPRGGAYPTSWWVASEVVSETVTLSLQGVSPGTYRLAVGLYDRTVTRLQAVAADGERVPDDRLVLPTEIEVAP